MIALAAALASLSLAADFPSCDPKASSQTVTFVHVTDLHAHYNARPGEHSPYALIRGKYEEIKRENPHTLFVDGGDDHEKGSLAETLSGGQATIEMTRAMRFDVRVLGNHDFAFGAKEALEHSRDPDSLVLASNLRPTGKGEMALGATDYAERSLGCVRIGFLGLVTRPWNERDEQYDGQYPGVRARYDWAAVAERILRRRKVKPDLTVLVSHLGREDDLALARKVRGIDLILGGHTHGVTWHPILVGGTRVLESGAFADHMTRVDATVDLASHAVLKWSDDSWSVDASLPADAAIDAEAAAVERRYAVDYSSAAGCACRAGDKKAAAEIAARAAMEVLGTDAAVVDLKNVWQPLPAGALFAQDFNDSFKLERQPPNSPGFSAFYVADVDGASLAALSDTIDISRWVYAGPEKPQRAKRLRIALPKRAALHADEFFSPRVTLGKPRFAAEAWDVLTRYARARLAAGQCVDDGCAAPPKADGQATDTSYRAEPNSKR